jgi:hypothetical protein
VAENQWLRKTIEFLRSTLLRNFTLQLNDDTVTAAAVHFRGLFPEARQGGKRSFVA